MGGSKEVSALERAADGTSVLNRLPDACQKYPDVIIQGSSGSPVLASRAVLHAMCPQLELGGPLYDLPTVEVSLDQEQIITLMRWEPKALQDKSRRDVSDTKQSHRHVGEEHDGTKSHAMSTIVDADGYETSGRARDGESAHVGSRGEEMGGIAFLRNKVEKIHVEAIKSFARAKDHIESSLPNLGFTSASIVPQNVATMQMPHGALAVLVVLCGGLCYSPAWWYNLEQGGFFMDDVMIKRNTNVVDPVFDWARLWRTDYWGLEMFDPKVWTHKSFRPITVLTFRWDYQTFSFFTTWFHRHNILLHFAVGLLIYYTGRRILLFSRSDGLLLAALFMAHPVHSESICYIVGRADLQCSIFILLAVLTYHQGLNVTDNIGKVASGKMIMHMLNHLHWGFYATLATILVILGGLCKETGFTTFGLLVLLEVFDILRGAKRSQVYTRVAILLTVAIPICFIRVWYTSGTEILRMDPFSNPIAAHKEWYGRFLSYWHVHGAYAKLLLFPWFLCYDYSADAVPLVLSLTDVRMLLAFSAYTTLSCAFLYTVTQVTENKPKGWPLSFGIMSFALAFMPMSNLLFPVGTLIAERLLYIPSIGFLVFLVTLCHRNFLYVVLCAWWVRCFARVQNWKNAEEITYVDGQIQLRSSRTQFNLGNYHLGRKEYDDALVAYNRAIEVDPEMRDAMPLYHAGQIHIFKGEYEKAHYLLGKAVKGYFSPLTLNEEEVFHDYGLACWHRGLPAEAIYNLQASIITSPRFAKGFNNLGCAMVLDGLSRMDEKAVTQGLASIEQAIGLSPHTALYWRNAAVLLQLIGDHTAAQGAWKRFQDLDATARGIFVIPEDCVWEFYFR